MLSQPKVNEKRCVVGQLPYGMEYTLRPPTNRDLKDIEQIWNSNEGNVARSIKVFSLLSGIAEDDLWDIDAESLEVMGKALELFPVFREQIS